MKLKRERIMKGVIIATLILLFGGVAAHVSQAQDDRNKPAPESPPSDPPSAPAESPRVSDPSPSSNDNSSSSSSNSSSNNDSNRGSDSGNSGSSSNDSGSSGETRRSKDDSGKPRRSDNGNRNSRERVAMPKMPVTAATSENGGSNSGGGRNRDRNRDWDGSRHRDGARGHDRHRHRHRQDDCYRVPLYDDTISYSAGTYGQSGGGTAQVSLSAYDRGYEDGLYTGANDARRGQTYDPERSHFYDDTPGYQSVVGSRDVYKRAYRDGFLRGYREGYQNWQKYFSGGVFHR